MVVMHNPFEELNKAQELYMEGNLTEAQNFLNRAESSLAPMQYYLYKSYLERANQNLEQSTKDLEIAEKDAVEHANFPLMLEILINEAYNAYLAGNYEALAVIVKKSSKYGGPNQDWVLLFRGIVEYQKKNFEKALSLWKLDANRMPLSAWMEKDFSDTFTPYWIKMHVARSDIEVGKTSTARIMLEEQIPLLSGDKLHDVLFLMGYSYAKEAATKGPLEAIPYYKLALSYFKKIPFMSEKYKLDRDSLTKQIDHHIVLMLQGSDYQNISYYIGVLDFLKANEEVAKLKDSLLAQFDRSLLLQAASNAAEVFSILKLIIPEGPERQTLEKSLREEVERQNLKNLEQFARSGRMLLEPEAIPPLPANELTEKKMDPLEELLSIQELLDKAIDENKINPQFNVEHSIDLQKALKLLTAFIDKHSEYSQAFIMLGQIRYLLGDFAGSAKAYETAIKMDPRNFQVYSYMALVYETVGQPQDAILLLLQSLKYAPKNADIWEQLADLYLITGNELDALPSFKEVLKIDSERYEVYLELGRLQVKLEVPEEARKNLQVYIDHHPDSKEALGLMLTALYNPLLNVDIKDILSLEKQRNEIYDRLYKLDPKNAEKIRKGYQAPPALISPPPQPEPNLPFLPQ